VLLGSSQLCYLWWAKITKTLLRALSQEKAEFLLVGAYALAVYGYPRATMDIDLWIMPSPKNACPSSEAA
jgi:hypothetical protein